MCGWKLTVAVEAEVNPAFLAAIYSAANLFAASITRSRQINHKTHTPTSHKDFKKQDVETTNTGNREEGKSGRIYKYI
jgi:hypothetical protein